MKKLLVLSALTLAISSSFAADVMIYGSIDTGIQVVHNKNGDTDISMEPGQSWGSRWGIYATEDLGNGYSVIANLQSGIATDTGETLYNSDRDRLFSRESSLSVKTPYGTVGMGRFGTLSGSVGTYSMWAGWADPFGTAYLDAGIQATMYGFGRADNSIVYQTPVFKGWQLGAMYSFDAQAGFADVDYDAVDAGDKNRLANVAVTYFGKRFAMQAAVEQIYWENDHRYNVRMKNSTDVGLAMQYDFDWAKIWVTGQYVHNVNMLGNHSVLADLAGVTSVKNDTGEGIQGYGLAVAVKKSIGKSDILAQVQYFDGKYNYSTTAQELDMQRYVFSLGCIYNLSKNTWLYSVASHSWGGGDWKDDRVEELGMQDRVNRSVLQFGINTRF